MVALTPWSIYCSIDAVINIGQHWHRHKENIQGTQRHSFFSRSPAINPGEVSIKTDFAWIYYFPTTDDTRHTDIASSFISTSGVVSYSKIFVLITGSSNLTTKRFRHSFWFWEIKLIQKNIHTLSIHVPIPQFRHSFRFWEIKLIQKNISSVRIEPGAPPYKNQRLSS
jgi:hypothetical protein